MIQQQISFPVLFPAALIIYSQSCKLDNNSQSLIILPFISRYSFCTRELFPEERPLGRLGSVTIAVKLFGHHYKLGVSQGAPGVATASATTGVVCSACVWTILSS